MGSGLRRLASIITSPEIFVLAGVFTALFLVLLRRTRRAIHREDKHREAADKALREHQRRLVDTLETIADGFVTFDRDWRYTYVNSEAEHLLGRPRTDLLGNVVWEVFPESVDGKASKELRLAAESRIGVGFEDFNPVLQRWYSNKAYPTPDGGLAVYFEDVTEQKRSQQALSESQHQLEAELTDTKLLQRISGELISEEDTGALFGKILDAAVQIMRSNCGSMQMLYPERGPVGELRMLAYRGFTPEAASHWEWVRADSASTWGIAFRTHQRALIANVELSRSVLGTHDLLIYSELGVNAIQSTPLLSRNGQLVGMISTHWRSPHIPSERDFRLLDILARQAADLIERMTSREQAIERERSARIEAERAVRLKDDFLATVSHELRTPLNAILGWSHILKIDIMNPERAATAAEVIERNGRLQAQLIEDLLDMSRILSGKMRLEVERVELPRIIDAAAQSIAPAADIKGIRVKRTIDPAVGPTMGDPARLQQVVWNLLSNAVKFTPKGGTIEITIEHADSHAEIRVSDTGEGIPPQFLPHLFDRFRQADASASRTHGGLGIGLALVRQIMELHGGKVEASSAGEGKGATFIIRLPLTTSQEENQYGSQRDSVRTTESPQYFPARLRGIRALVVDDEADSLIIVRRMLQENEAIVTTAESSEEALQILSLRTVDVIVSDIGMPGRDGYAFIAEVRHRGIQTPAVALTAYARPEDRTKSLASGYQAHISKPAEIGELLEAVASLANRRAVSSRRIS